MNMPSIIEEGTFFYSFRLSKGPIAIIHSSKTGVQNRSKKEKIVGKLNRRYEMEDKLCAVHVDQIEGMANVVEDSYYEDEDKGFLCNYISVIKSPGRFMKDAFYGSFYAPHSRS